MHVDLFVEFFVHVLHALSITSAITLCCHAFTVLVAFSFPSASRANLGQDSTFAKVALHNLGKEGSPSSQDLYIPT